MTSWSSCCCSLGLKIGELYYHVGLHFGLLSFETPCIAQRQVSSPNRLRKILPPIITIISYTQSGFVHGRLITDNMYWLLLKLRIILVKKEGKVGEVSLNLDIRKVYDWVEWV